MVPACHFWGKSWPSFGSRFDVRTACLLLQNESAFVSAFLIDSHQSSTCRHVDLWGAIIWSEFSIVSRHVTGGYGKRAEANGANVCTAGATVRAQESWECRGPPDGPVLGGCRPTTAGHAGPDGPAAGLCAPGAGHGARRPSLPRGAGKPYSAGSHASIAHCSSRQCKSMDGYDYSTW